ncbi:MAG: hypothetical protein LBF87_01640 [Treponema sp.]|jgi:gamma-glutamylcysteine synthetase|nr:hypothetical protein [Treponema sp.]
MNKTLRGYGTVAAVLMVRRKGRYFIDHTARNISSITNNVQLRYTAHCYQTVKDYGTWLVETFSYVCIKRPSLRFTI